MGYRSDVKVVDATLRDGGLVNDFYFSDEFVKALYETNIKAAWIIWNSAIKHQAKCLILINSENGSSVMMTI